MNIKKYSLISDLELKNLKFNICTRYIPILKEIKQYIRGWLSSYVCLPENLREFYLEDVCKAIVNDKSRIINDRISIPYTALIIHVKKKNEVNF